MMIGELVASIDLAFCRLARSRFTSLTVLLVIFSILWNGLGVLPRQPYRRVAENPYDKLADFDENTFQESPLLPLIGYYTGLTTKRTFSAMAGVWILAGLLSLAFLGRKRFGPEVGMLSLGMAIGHPVTLVMYSWLGTPDGITFLLTALLFFVQSYPLIFLVAFLGALNHPILLFAGSALILLRLLANEERVRPLHLLVLFLGFTLGTLAVQMYLAVNDIEVFSRLEFLRERTFGSWFWHNISWLPHALFSLHGVLWLALGLSVLWGFRKNRRYFAILILLQLAFYGITYFSIDTTRIFSLLAWAPTIHAIQYSLRLAEQEDDPGIGQRHRQAMIVIALLALVQPRIYLWGGEIHGSGFNEFYIPFLQQARWRGLW